MVMSVEMKYNGIERWRFLRGIFWDRLLHLIIARLEAQFWHRAAKFPKPTLCPRHAHITQIYVLYYLIYAKTRTSESDGNFFHHSTPSYLFKDLWLSKVLCGAWRSLRTSNCTLSLNWEVELSFGAGRSTCNCVSDKLELAMLRGSKQYIFQKFPVHLYVRCIKN